MNTIIKKCVSLLAVSLLASANVFAADKIAVLNFEAAVFQTEVAQKRANSMKQSPEVAALSAKMETLRSELQSMNKDAEINRMMWSEAQAAEYKNKADYKLKDLQLAAKKLKQSEQSLMQELFKELGPQVDKVVKEIIEAEGIGLVLKAEAAHWANGSFDITKKVVDKLNKK